MNFSISFTQLSAPVVSVWLHEDGRLETVDFTSHHSRSDWLHQPQLMLVLYNDQYYIQPVIGAQGDRQPLTQQPMSDLNTQTKSYALALQSNLISEPNENDKHDLTLYYDDDTFMKLCTAGPYGEDTQTMV